MARRMPAPMVVALDRFTQVLGWELDAPVVCLSLVDTKRRLLTSAIGAPPHVALIISWSFARYVTTGEPLLVSDARLDPRVAHCPVVRDGTVAAYMGVRLTARDGHAVGTLSAMDSKPRSWTLPQLAFVRQLCNRITNEIEFGTPATMM